MLNENFGFGVSEKLDDDDTYSRKEGTNDQSENGFKLTKDVEQELYQKCKKLINFSYIIWFF